MATEVKRKKRTVLVGLLQIGLIGAFVLLAIVLSRAPSGDDVRARADASAVGGSGAREAPAVLVSVIHPEAATNRITIAATGSVIVRNYVEMAPQLTGRVAWVANALRAGGRFDAGDVLLRLEKRDFELALAQANADIHAARATLMLQTAQSDAAIANYAILNPGKKVPPLVAKTPQIEQAKAALAAAQARADVLALDLERTDFALPFAGRVVSSSAEIGQLLNRGQSFGQAFDIEAVEAVVPIAPADLAKLTPPIGRRATLSAQGKTTSGVVSRLSPQLDQRTRFAKLFLALDDLRVFVPGTFVDVDLEGPVLTNTFLLPEAAEQINGRVFVVEAERLRTVQTELLGRVDEGLVVAAFDIKDGVVVGAVPGGRDALRVVTSQHRYE